MDQTHFTEERKTQSPTKIAPIISSSPQKGRNLLASLEKFEIPQELESPSLGPNLEGSLKRNSFEHTAKFRSSHLSQAASQRYDDHDNEEHELSTLHNL